jgi:LysM repeat protein
VISFESSRGALPQVLGWIPLHARYQILLLVLILGAILALSGCGQVITKVSPTPTVTPTTRPMAVATLRPTATPAPYTPAPTATPTLTPTPIIYVIRKGDTPLGIANQFGVSLRDLQDTNGITDPRALRVGQELIIPEKDEPRDDSPTAVPTPLPFVIENVTFSNTTLGGLWGLGEIRNTSGLDLEQVALSAALLDSDGNVLAEEHVPVQLELVAPGERAPFAVRFSTPPRTFASYLITPLTAIPGYTGNYYRDLIVKESSGEGERYSTYTVSGKITNIGPEDAVDVVVTTTIYDALGRVIGTRRVPPEHNVIPRGGDTTFAVQITPIGGPVSSYGVTVLGRRPPTPTPEAGQQ